MDSFEHSLPQEQPLILLVEDELLIRVLASDILAAAGYRVLDATDADEALTIIETKPQIVALVADVKLPGTIDGFGLAHLVASRWPNVGIVITSAHVTPGPGDMPDGAAFLAKPYQLSALAESVRTVIDERRRPITVIAVPDA